MKIHSWYRIKCWFSNFRSILKSVEKILH